MLVLQLALARGRREAVLALVLFTAMVISHQLTPYWVLGALALIALLRRVSWWLVAGCAVAALGFLGLNLETVSDFGLFSGVDVAANAQTSGREWSSAARQGDSLMSRTATVLVWAATALVLGLRLLRRRPWAVEAVVAFSPLALLLAQSYGGEAILQVALYSLAGCAALSGRWCTAC
ncbi:hypothetical protein [Nocardioides alcanivorans]|uniref:hypothetical protein n=1 Tax=Nocardioides alcanivorans TaxID=2897352 RepID=UPI001F3D023E|nr:hypothetical protein [Nocardioides alcanivorans]